MSPTVHIDAGGHTCIQVLIGRKNVTYIPMDASGLHVKKCGIAAFDVSWKSVPEYSAASAAEKYLASQAAQYYISGEARHHLEEIIKSGASTTKENIMATAQTATKGKKINAGAAEAIGKLIAAGKAAEKAAEKPAPARFDQTTAATIGKAAKALGDVAKTTKAAAKDAKAVKPAAKDAKPAAKATKPAAKDAKPAAKDAKPAAKPAKPAAKGAKPAAKGAKPAAKATKPAGGARYAGMSIKPLFKANEVAAREGTWTRFMIMAALNAATTDAAQATVDKSKEFSGKRVDFNWLVAKQYISLK